MRLTQTELGLLALIIAYIAFFTHPPPSHITNLLETPVGHMIALVGILYVTVYKSLIVGLFLGIAYIMTVRTVTEYLDEKEQAPKEEKKQPSSSGTPPPAVTGALGSMMKKGDTRLPQTQGKDSTAKPAPTTQPKPTPPKTVENFASF